ncbi:MAG: methylated-DNA--[protein]-cysteine S-methyltransferase [Muribaculaceae bacterium]|nr:methylated-DNA--[protein]-cysteine S-methyltransferase [Muribaculaceae bacterium]
MITYLNFPPGTILLEEQNGVLTRCLFSAEAPGGVCADVSHDGVLARAATQLAEYFTGVRTQFELPLAPAATAFQDAVRRALRGIPYGTTATYSELAGMMGCPGAVRVVGRALGANPFHVIVPCHRIVPATGYPGGYAAGSEIKGYLLRLEKAR